MDKRPTEEELGDQYEAAWEEWHASGDAELWNTVVGDGLDAEDGESRYRLPDGSVARNGLSEECRGLTWGEIRELANERQPPESWR